LSPAPGPHAFNFQKWIKGELGVFREEVDFWIQDHDLPTFGREA
jgi:hypothetical protein